MILESIELLDSSSLTIEQLTEKINSGVYDDILSSYSMLVMTNLGLVKINKTTKEIIINSTVDLSGFVKVEEGKTLISSETLTNLTNNQHSHENKIILDNITEVNIQTWDNKLEKTDVPAFTFEADGVLSVTIGENTYRYAPIVEIENT